MTAKKQGKQKEPRELDVPKGQAVTMLDYEGSPVVTSSKSKDSTKRGSS